MRAALVELKSAIERLFLKGIFYGCIFLIILDHFRPPVSGLAVLSKLFFG